MTASTEKVPGASAAGTITIGGDLTVNRLGFGAMRITGKGIWGEPDDLDEARSVMRSAVEHEVTFIDTADSYGPHVSERLICEALHPYPENVVIATKGGLERPEPYKWTDNSTPEHLREACEGSLKRLGLEQIPLYQWHRPDPDVPLADAIGTLIELQREGKIRHLGVSNVTLEQLQQIQRMTTIVSVQNRYNIGTRESEAVVDYCEDNGLAFIPWAPMHDVADTPAAFEIATRHDVTPRQLVLAWLLARSPAILPIPGTGSVAHLKDNIAAASIRLSDDEVRSLTAR